MKNKSIILFVALLLIYTFLSLNGCAPKPVQDCWVGVKGSRSDSNKKVLKQRKELEKRNDKRIF